MVESDRRSYRLSIDRSQITGSVGEGNEPNNVTEGRTRRT